MGGHRRGLVGVLAAGCLAATVVAGCSSTETGGPVDASGAASATSAAPGSDQPDEPQGSLSEALLPTSELPPELQYQQINEFPDLTDVFANATVEPSECGTPEALQPYGDPSGLEAAVHVGNGPPGTLVVGLIRGPEDLDLGRSQRTLQQCPTFTIRTPEVTLTTVQESVPAPDFGADDMIAYRQTITPGGAAAPVQETAFLAAADGGVVVTVTGTIGDMAQLEDLMSKALQRKRDVLG